MIFAQAATTLPDPHSFSSIGWVLVILVSIITGLRQGIGFVKEIKDKPAASEVRAEVLDRFVPKEQFCAHVERNDITHEQIFTKIGGVERGAKSTIETQVEVVRKDLMAAGRDIAGLKVETQLQNQSLARVESKLDRVIERL